MAAPGAGGVSRHAGLVLFFGPALGGAGAPELFCTAPSFHSSPPRRSLRARSLSSLHGAVPLRPCGVRRQWRAAAAWAWWVSAVLASRCAASLVETWTALAGRQCVVEHCQSRQHIQELRETKLRLSAVCSGHRPAMKRRPGQRRQDGCGSCARDGASLCLRNGQRCRRRSLQRRVPQQHRAFPHRPARL